MAGGKETPRQKMIGMMYLVLTALLALNVSKEIINAFVKLDQKLMESNALFISESDEIMIEFENAMILKQNKKSVKPVYDKAIKVRKMAFEIDKFINIDCKNELIKEVENSDWITVDEKNQRFNTRNPMEIETKDDYDVATRLFGGESGTNGFEKGAEIRKRIHKFRDELLSFITEFEYAGKKYKFNPSKIDDSDSNTIARTLETELKKSVYEKDRDKVKAIYKLLTLPENLKDNEELVPWQFGTFDHAPVVAASAMFTALSNDIRNAEMKALELLRSKISPEIVKVNKVDILASARTNYINMGDSLDLNVMMAAYDTTDIPIIKYGIDSDTLNESSWKEIKGKIKLNGNQSGIHHVKGVMGIREKGVLTWKPWKFTYEVGQPMAIISNSELNILYADWENKIEATASGYSSENIILTGSSGMQRKGDFYMIKPSKSMAGSKITLNVIGKNADGTTRPLGKKEFKVRRMPVPLVYVGTANNMTQGSIDKVKLLQGGLITASYDPNNVVIDARFTVTRFKMTISKEGVSKEYPGTGNKLTPAMINVIGLLPSKSLINFSDITISGPNNSVFSGPNVAFTLK
jgi:gliding motility-associated protein GldM